VDIDDNILDKNCRENQTAPFIFNNFFPRENRVTYEIMWKSMVQSDRPQVTALHAG
jgi:hypothetical protein